MAYTFNGSTQYLRAQYSTNSLVSAWPMTVFCRAKSGDTSNNQVAATLIYSNSPYSGIALYMTGAVALDPVAFDRLGVASVISSVSYASGAWVAMAGRAASNTVFDIDAENTVTTGATTSVVWQNVGDVNIGARLTPTFNQGLNGSVAAYAIWSAILTDGEIASLVAGFSPRRVRPQSLVFYAPLVRALVVPRSLVNPTVALNAVAAPTVSDHPRSYGF